MVELNREGFKALPQDRKDDMLFDSICGTEQTLHEVVEIVKDLAKSPWRMAIPPVSWKAIGGFTIVMALIIKGDVDRAFKLIGLLIGI